ncbi:hypothetical protein HNP73_002291 [Amaricoccus macauensis]|uniref:Uncharacterized protein n=1 Tax=Amaricoccus macauensis TaxID=57001 RepID=A0A840SP36_9RHOB|nr:hypothetical protein [Amaricoccus macauensis]MBB5222355.1 hypothetical protein [Amaricoccus macauensis]
MIELVFMACLIGHPDVCEQRTLGFITEGGGAMACLKEAPPTLATWSVEHPGYRIGAWHCQDSSRRSEEA